MNFLSYSSPFLILFLSFSYWFVGTKHIFKILVLWLWYSMHIFFFDAVLSFHILFRAILVVQKFSFCNCESNFVLFINLLTFKFHVPSYLPHIFKYFKTKTNLHNVLTAIKAVCLIFLKINYQHENIEYGHSSSF